jgi:hypothetical protein
MPEAANVQKLREEPVQKVVATAVSIVVGLADDRQITFQTGYEGDETDDAVNGRLDRTMRFANRLKAIYSLPNLEDELEQHETVLARFIEDQAAIVDRYENEQAGRAAELAAKRRDAEARHATSGKRGGYKPEGATKRDLEIIAKAALDAEASHKQNRDIAQKTHERYVQEIETRKAKIAKAKALAEG